MTAPNDPHTRHHDQLIGQRLPDWLRRATPEQVSRLHQCMALSLYFRERAQGILNRLQGLDAFARPLLEDALARAVGHAVSLDALAFRQGYREPVITSMPVGYPVRTAVYRNQPVLEAALRNFTEAQAQAGGLLPGCKLISQVALAKVPDAAQFANLCRRLDIGARYQAHLTAQLQPASGPDEPPGAASRRVQSVLARHHRYGAWVDAQVAHLKGEITDADMAMIDQLCALRPDPTHEGAAVRAGRLRMLGCTLEHILVIEVRDDRFAPLWHSTRRVLVHVPGDPHRPWRVHATLRQFANALGKLLRTPAYQTFFAQFVRRADAPQFFAEVQSRYAGLSDLANCALDEHVQPWSGAVFDALALARIEQIKADARSLAIPAAQLDLEARDAHDRWLTEAGWTLLNLAGLFVPALGVTLLAVATWELLGEIYHGVQAWRDGDCSEALDHALNVAGDLAIAAATAAGITAARAVWQRTLWVDALLPARLQDGSTRLWHEDLSAWRLTQVPAGALRDAQGVYRLGEACWVTIDTAVYPVRQRADLTWEMLPRDGYAPPVLHNGDGAWRCAWEQPLEWEDPRYLLRRLGHHFEALDDAQADELLLAHDLQPAHLRAVHALGQRIDPVVRDSAMRYDLDRRLRGVIAQLRGGTLPGDTVLLALIQRLPGASGLSNAALGELAWEERRALFDALYRSVQPTASRGLYALQRQFPRLPQGVAQRLLDEARPLERQRLYHQARVPLGLAEAARDASLRTRVARVYEGFFLDAEQDADLARVAIRLLDASLPTDTGRTWRLVDADTATVDGINAMLPSREGDVTVLHRGGRFQRLDRHGQPLDTPGELFDCLARSLSPTQRDGLNLNSPVAHNLRVRLGRAAAQRREDVRGWLGREPRQSGFVPPVRQRDGRVGYPLSGRRAGRRAVRSLHARIRLLYPTLSEAEIDAWLADMQAREIDINLQLSRLDDELQALRTHLRIWSDTPRSLMLRAERSHLRNALIDGWQRRLPRTMEHGQQPMGYRLSIWAMAVAELPSLPPRVSFAHVSELSLMGMSLASVPESFLRAFPQLRMLELANNELTRLPPYLDQLLRLEELDVYGNHIALDGEQAVMLSRCRSLRSLNLSFNPLGRVFSVADIPHLRRLHLRGTELPAFPPGLLARPLLTIADLRNNSITEVPEAFYQVPPWTSGAIMLGENPLGPGQLRRLNGFMAANGWLPEALAESGGAPALDQGAALQQGWGDARRSWLTVLQADQAEAFGQAWDALAEQPVGWDFMDLLRRLQESVDFINHPERLGARVWGVVDAAQSHADLRQTLFELATTERTCQDSVVSNFSALEVQVMVWHAEQQALRGGEQAALLRLGRQLWRLDTLDRVALEDIQARIADGSNPDEVEVRLAYRLALRDEFDLPGQPGDMAYRQVAGVNAQRIMRARAQLLEGETPEALAASLVDRGFWQTDLVQRHEQVFEALDQRFYSRMQVIEEMAQGRSYDEVETNMRAELQRLASRLAELTGLPKPEDLAQRAAYHESVASAARAVGDQRDALARLQADTLFANAMRAVPTPMTSDSYAQWMVQVRDQRQAARREQMLVLTREVLDRPATPAPDSEEPVPGPSGMSNHH